MQLLFDGLKLMVAGMGMVFVFLCIMILWINVSSKLSTRFAHVFPVEPVAAPGPRRRPAARTGVGPDRKRLVAVISAAIQMYRRDHSDK